MKPELSRRRVLQVGAAMGALALAGCGNGQSGDEESGNASLQFAWWGSTERHNKTQAALRAFQKEHPGIKVTTQFSGWDGYWEKLATQTAGGNAPDVIQIDYSYIGEYARRGSLLALDSLSGDVLDLSEFDEDAPGRPSRRTRPRPRAVTFEGSVRPARRCRRGCRRPGPGRAAGG